MLKNESPIDSRSAAMYSPLSLAYIGDCVYELFVREKLILEHNMSNGKLHAAAQKFVSAGGQCSGFEKIEAMLTPEETTVFKRGRNAHSSHNRNNSVDEYKCATGLETLFGYLYLIGQTDRLSELFGVISQSE